MNLTGQNFLGFRRTGGEKTFTAYSTLAGGELPVSFIRGTGKDVDEAAGLAWSAFAKYRNLPAVKRAEFLDAIAAEIMEAGDILIERCVAETGLPAARITGERLRTCNQLKLFASLLRDGWWVDARIDTAQPERQPLPKPDLRRMLTAIGPVVVYGASNFPLAFSTAGGDTASALAAGCPVIVKGHSSHPGTNEIVAAAIIRAAQRTGMPEGVFSSLNLSNEESVSLVKHPHVKAVGFTGSRQVGLLLFEAAMARPEPIPVFAEMSSVNPVIMLPGALRDNASGLAKGLVGSVTLGAGQFCTNPGLVLVVNDEHTTRFIDEFSRAFAAAEPASMLNRKICKAYQEGISRMQKEKTVKSVAASTGTASEEKSQGAPEAFIATAADFLANKQLGEEIFGPATLFVLCDNADQLAHVLESLDGQLTATIHSAGDEKSLVSRLLDIVTVKAGRIISGGFPTGVEVCHAMQHGGPFPSTTDTRFTSVGTAAIDRFLRPVAFQDFSDDLLPEALRNSNPLGILRLVNGAWSREAIS